MFKKLLLGLTAAFFFAQEAPAQTLFTYGTKPVSQQEFTRAFEKNPSPGNRQKAMEEYLPLFINYKLKVQDAIDKKMDTLPNQKAEFENYQAQLFENYINIKAKTNHLVEEAFERSQKDIFLGDIFIGFNSADSLSIKQARLAAENAIKSLDANQDFESVAKQYSTEEGNKASGGKAGWITVFSVPYPFETIIYKLPIGGYSKPVKTGFGYHIFKKMAERPAAGIVKVAQIMLINADKTNSTNETRNAKLADSLFNALQKGASFDSLAYSFSNDRTSYDNGGILPEFGVGTYAGIFEDAAFSLKTKGEISKPFATEYGWHILKLVEKKPVSSSPEDIESNTILTQKVKSTGRSHDAKNAYLKSVMPALKYKAFPVNEKELFRFTDSSITTNNVAGLPVNGKTPLFSFGKTTITASNWLQYVKTAKLNPGSEHKAYADLYPAFKMASTEQFLFKNLATIDPSFLIQSREFREANLLFEAMDKNVWTKAAADTAGLRNWYNSHKKDYKWNESALAVLITCTDSSILDPVITSLEKEPSSWHTLSETYPSGFIADSGRYELGQLPANNNNLAPGNLTKPVKNDLDGSYSFARIYKILEQGEQRTFDEAKGFVINDYQQSLEEKWVAALRKKYPVKVNQVTWKNLLLKQANLSAK